KSEYDTMHELAATELKQTHSRIEADFASDQRRAKRKLGEENWEANTVYEATQNAPKQQLEQETKDIEATQATIRQAFELANRHPVHCRISNLRKSAPGAAISPPASAQSTTSPPIPIENPAEKLRDLAQQAVAQLDSLRRAKAPHVFIGGKPWGMS